MADPLSIAASVAGLTSLGIQVTQSLVDFYRAHKNRKSELAGITARLEDLVDTFHHLEKSLSARVFQPDERNLVTRIEASINNCDELIRELEEECNKLNDTTKSLTVISRRAAYPFKRSTLEKLDEDISEIRENLRFALEVLNLNHSQRVEDGIADIKALLELVGTRQISSDLVHWLNAPDATVNHNTACAKKHPGTGLWLTQSSGFLHWLTEPNSIIWLNGFAGSGKSVLCSTAIQAVLRHRGSERGIGIAFFYFTFNDESKQDDSSMIRALLLQLSNQLEDGHADLKQLQKSHQTGTPPVPAMLPYLQRMIQRFRQVYILLDALDESPRTGPRVRVLDAIETLQKYGLHQLHLFITSRAETDIRDSLDLPMNEQVTMQNAGIDEDITKFVSGQLVGDRRLRKLSAYHNKIQEALTSGAKGVFRWVECQLRSLQSCPRSEHILDRVLNSLPESLDETYERMLCNIDSYLVEDARRILTLLCFAFRPLEVQELIDGVAVETVGCRGLNRKRRLQDADDIRDICQGLVDVELDHTEPSDHLDQLPESGLVLTARIAHFSVQEYLESERIHVQKAKTFGLDCVIAHAEIAQICLLYLLDNGLSISTLNEGVPKELPLAPYAATHWYRHYKEIANAEPGLSSLITDLFVRQQSFGFWACLHDVGQFLGWNDFRPQLDHIASPIYYASLLGLDLLVQTLLDKGADINAQGGSYGNALQAASRGGHEPIVQLLLKEGAHVNAQGGRHDNALSAACQKGSTTIVQLLLKEGADVNAQFPDYGTGTALMESCAQGDVSLVQLLLKEGADVNAQGGTYGSALKAACGYGHKTVAQLLLEEGADVNTQGGTFSDALQAACCSGDVEIVRMLLERGADVNAVGQGRYGSALALASCRGDIEIVRVLLEAGANINYTGQGRCESALIAASEEGDVETVRMLLERGADINAVDQGQYGSALASASCRGHIEILRVLLEAGANINYTGQGQYDSALALASCRGHTENVRVLLEAGAKVNYAGGGQSPALIQGCEQGHVEVTRLLLEAGANVNGEGLSDSALAEASLHGHVEVVQILLEAGAHVNDTGGADGLSALTAASLEGQVEVVRLLLEAGANVNDADALATASEGGYIDIVRMLLDKGAEINATDGFLRTSLQAAREGDNDEMVQLLLEHGAIDIPGVTSEVKNPEASDSEEDNVESEEPRVEEI
ncbi:MAG: hypothetical protein Q9168_007966 [Polycauliona sp. 1 TL-2023]